MGKLIVKTDPRVNEVFANYPDFVRDKMQQLREWVIETAEDTEGISLLEETLKWGEPSFVTKNGSTLRMDWKEKTPHQYAMYFQCTSRLVDTFRLVFDQKFQYEGKRAIIFQCSECAICGVNLLDSAAQQIMLCTTVTSEFCIAPRNHRTVRFQCSKSSVRGSNVLDCSQLLTNTSPFRFLAV